MSDLQNSCPRLDPSRLLKMLQSEDVHQQHQALLIACPCRNRYYDQEIWRAICQVRATTPDGRVRDRANHVMNTLYERARLDMRWVQLLRWLTEQGYAIFVPPWLQKQVGRCSPWAAGVRLPRVTLGDVPSLIEMLASESADDQAQALQALCPGGSRQYHRKVWLTLFHACHGPDQALAAQAIEATRRLLEHSGSDANAQPVLQWLHHKLCSPAPGGPADVVEALRGTLQRPLCQPAKPVTRRREDPALRGGAQIAVDRLIEAVRACRGSRALRKALYALRQTQDPYALAVLAEYVGHPEPAINSLAKSLLTPRAKEAGAAPPQKDYRPRRQTSRRR